MLLGFIDLVLNDRKQRISERQLLAYAPADEEAAGEAIPSTWLLRQKKKLQEPF